MDGHVKHGSFDDASVLCHSSAIFEVKRNMQSKNGAILFDKSRKDMKETRLVWFYKIACIFQGREKKVAHQTTTKLQNSTNSLIGLC